MSDYLTVNIYFFICFVLFHSMAPQVFGSSSALILCLHMPSLDYIWVKLLDMNQVIRIVQY